MGLMNRMTILMMKKRWIWLKETVNLGTLKRRPAKAMTLECHQTVRCREMAKRQTKTRNAATKRIEVETRKGVVIKKTAKRGKARTERKAKISMGNTAETEKEVAIKAVAVIEKEIKTGKEKTTVKDARIPREEKTEKRIVVEVENQTGKAEGIRKGEIRKEVETVEGVAETRKEAKEVRVAIRRKQVAGNLVKIRKVGGLEIKKKVVESLKEIRRVVSPGIENGVADLRVRKEAEKSREAESQVGKEKADGHRGVEPQKALKKAPRSYADVDISLIGRIAVKIIERNFTFFYIDRSSSQTVSILSVFL